MTLYSRLAHALDQGMNIKLALMATGLDAKTFWLYLDDQLFTFDMIVELEIMLNEWEG